MKPAAADVAAAVVDAIAASPPAQMRLSLNETSSTAAFGIQGQQQHLTIPDSIPSIIN